MRQAVRRLTQRRKGGGVRLSDVCTWLPFERHIEHLIGPVAMLTAFDYEQQIFDDTAKRRYLTDLEHTWHGCAGHDTFIRECGNSCYVMGKQNTIILGCPSQHLRIFCSGKADILDTDKVNLWRAAKHATYNIVVEVLVSKQSKHTLIGSCRTTCKQARANIVWLEPLLVLLPHPRRFLPTLMKICFNLSLVLQVVSQHGINVR